MRAARAVRGAAHRIAPHRARDHARASRHAPPAALHGRAGLAAGRHTKGDVLKKTVRVRRDACGNNASDPRQIMLTDLARSGQHRVLINVAVRKRDKDRHQAPKIANSAAAMQIPAAVRHISAYRGGSGRTPSPPEPFARNSTSDTRNSDPHSVLNSHFLQ